MKVGDQVKAKDETQIGEIIGGGISKVQSRKYFKVQFPNPSRIRDFFPEDLEIVGKVGEYCPKCEWHHNQCLKLSKIQLKQIAKIDRLTSQNAKLKKQMKELKGSTNADQN